MSRTKVTWRARKVPRNPANPPSRTPASRFSLEAIRVHEAIRLQNGRFFLGFLGPFLFFAPCSSRKPASRSPFLLRSAWQCHPPRKRYQRRRQNGSLDLL